MLRTWKGSVVSAAVGAIALVGLISATPTPAHAQAPVCVATMDPRLIEGCTLVYDAAVYCSRQWDGCSRNAQRVQQGYQWTQRQVRNTVTDVQNARHRYNQI